jgi:dihydroorotase
MTTLLKGGYVADAVEGMSGKRDLLIKNGIIVDTGTIEPPESCAVYDCTGLTVVPGLFDMHVHLRDPGQVHKEDIISGANAAAAGGVTALLCMPNTIPAVDNAETLTYIKNKAKNAKVNIYPAAAITKGLDGEELCDFEKLKKFGAVALSDDGRPVRNANLMYRALIAAKKAGLPIISHCEDLDIIDGGIVNTGVADRLGVKGMSRVSENIITAREILLAYEAETHVHIAHVSTKESIEMIRAAKSIRKGGFKLTCETAPHYFTLTEDALVSKDADYRMNPPLRTAEYVCAVKSAVTDGTIDCIVTDHAPHAAKEKSDFLTAPNGVIGLETLFSAVITEFYHTKLLSVEKIVELLCINPRKIVNIEKNVRFPQIGSKADIVAADLNREWIVSPGEMHSKSRNTCFKGMKLKGKIKYTFVNGGEVYVA